MSVPHDHTGSAPDERSKNRLWHLGFWPSLVVVALSVAIGCQHIAARLHDDPVIRKADRLDVMEMKLKRGAQPGAFTRPLVVFFGDSTVASYPTGRSLPQYAALALDAQDPGWSTTIISLAAAGTGVGPYAFYADHVAEAAPDLVIWQLSFFQFSDRWLDQNGVPEMIGAVSANRLPGLLALPYEEYGLTLSDIILYQLIERLDWRPLHRWLGRTQLLSGHMREVAEERLNPNRGRRPEARFKAARGRENWHRVRAHNSRGRYNAVGESIHFGETLHGVPSDQLALQFLGSGLDALVGRGIPVLVYLNPTNTHNLKTVGAFDEKGIHATVEAIRHRVEASGATFLDLHEMLEDDDFNDSAGHFTHENDFAVSRRISLRIARASAAALREARREQAVRDAARQAGGHD